MRRIIIITICLLTLLLASGASARNYAVLISAGNTTSDNSYTNSEYWYDMFLLYTMLIDEGYGHDEIYVIYGYGNDYNSSRTCYQNPYPDDIVDYRVNQTNIAAVFSELGGIMTEDDQLFVWWMGHGDRQYSGGEYHTVMLIETLGQWIYDYQFAAWVNQVENYSRRVVAVMTCKSGGILNDFPEEDTVAMSSATIYVNSESDWLCDTVHAEFTYYLATAWHKQTPCEICGTINVDQNFNNKISVWEAFDHAHENMSGSIPQMGDEGDIADDTHLSHDLTAIGDSGPAPASIRLAAHPNPFNPATKISWHLAEAGEMRLAIYDLSGRFVTQLSDGPQPAGAGEAVWDGRDAAGNALPTGVYFTRVESGGETLSRKLVLLK